LIWSICSSARASSYVVSLLPAARGQGYGTEVIRLLCQHGFRNRNLRPPEGSPYVVSPLLSRLLSPRLHRLDPDPAAHTRSSHTAQTPDIR
jgi:hypothetical protein